MSGNNHRAVQNMAKHSVQFLFTHCHGMDWLALSETRRITFVTGGFLSFLDRPQKWYSTEARLLTVDSDHRTEETDLSLQYTIHLCLHLGVNIRLIFYHSDSPTKKRGGSIVRLSSLACSVKHRNPTCGSSFWISR